MRMKLVICLLFSLVLASTLYAGEIKSGYMDSGPYSANSSLLQYNWVNSTGAPIYIKQVTIWLGADMGMQTDLFACVYKMSDGTQLSCVGWDRYASPTGLHQWTQTFAPDWITLLPGDALVLYTACNGSGGKCHAWVIFHYTTGPR